MNHRKDGPTTNKHLRGVKDGRNVLGMAPITYCRSRCLLAVIILAVAVQSPQKYLYDLIWCIVDGVAITDSTHLEGVEDGRKVLVELDVHNGTDNLGYAPHAASVHSRRGMEARATCS